LGLALVILPFFATTAHAGTAPSLSATPYQLRTAAPDAGIIPLWDTSWWITVQSARGSAPLARIEYTARFRESTDPHSVAGAVDISDAQHDRVGGRLVVTCRTRSDYDRKLRVKLRVTDANGASSEWVEVDFPVHENGGDPVIAAMPVSVAPKVDRRSEPLGAVEVEANDRMSIGEVKEALKRKAHDQGGEAAVNFRMVSSTAERVTFAADVIRYVDVPRPVPASSPAAPATPENSDRILGEITMPAAR
jgi:hypothetical protein